MVRREQWTALTGRAVATRPPTPAEFCEAGIPRFDHAAGDGLEVVDNYTVPIDRVLRIRVPDSRVVTEWEGP